MHEWNIWKKYEYGKAWKFNFIQSVFFCRSLRFLFKKKNEKAETPGNLPKSSCYIEKKCYCSGKGALRKKTEKENSVNVSFCFQT